MHLSSDWEMVLSDPASSAFHDTKLSSQVQPCCQTASRALVLDVRILDTRL